MTDARTTGRTEDADWEIGVRRTVPAEADAVWALLRSPEGTAVWLGGPLAIAEGPYRLDDGADGEVRVDEPGSHVRLTWRPPGREEATVVQVRVLPAKSGAAMRDRWIAVIDRLREKLEG